MEMEPAATKFGVKRNNRQISRIEVYCLGYKFALSAKILKVNQVCEFARDAKYLLANLPTCLLVVWPRYEITGRNLYSAGRIKSRR
jgi:hypothetical protein